MRQRLAGTAGGSGVRGHLDADALDRGRGNRKTSGLLVGSEGVRKPALLGIHGRERAHGLHAARASPDSTRLVARALQELQGPLTVAESVVVDADAVQRLSLIAPPLALLREGERQVEQSQ